VIKDGRVILAKLQHVHLVLLVVIFRIKRSVLLMGNASLVLVFAPTGGPGMLVKHHLIHVMRWNVENMVIVQ
jgi:hypothetical protein